MDYADVILPADCKDIPRGYINSTSLRFLGRYKGYNIVCEPREGTPSEFYLDEQPEDLNTDTDSIQVHHSVSTSFYTRFRASGRTGMDPNCHAGILYEAIRLLCPNL